MRRLTVAFVALALLLGLVGTSVAQGNTAATGQFSPAGSLAEARVGHTATLLSDGRVLVVGGWDGFRGPDSLVASAVVWDPATATFSPAGSLAEARAGHTATRLPDGRVLVVGGWDSLWSESDLASAEVWDPATATFSPAGSLAEGRSFHTATPLSDGRVLVIGGWNDEADPASAEVWDPATATFSPTGSLAEARVGHTATLLSDGRVLVVGGSDTYLQYLASAEVWDPATGHFSPAGSLAEARDDHSATLLPDGRVLVIGGAGGDFFSEDYELLASAEMWDPVTASFGPAGALTVGRASHSATLLPDGRVLVVGGGGDTSDILPSMVWDPATAAFGLAGFPARPRGNHTATLLPDGRVLVIGGHEASAEVWEPIDAAP